MSNNGLVTCEYRNLIKSTFSNDNIKSKINSAVSKTKNSKSGNKTGKENVLNVLREEGVVDMILENLMQRINATSIVDKKIDQNYLVRDLIPPSTGQYLSFTVIKLSNLADYLISHNDNVNDKFEYDIKRKDTNNFTNGLQYFISFQKQRINSDIFPCYKETLINQQNYIKMSERPEYGVDSLISLSAPLHFVLIKQNMLTGESVLVSSQVIEWRMVLCSDTWASRISIDLQGVFDECKSIVGTIELELQLVPGCSNNIPVTPIDQIQFQEYLRRENLEYGSDKQRKFLSYAKQWWQEFCQIHPPTNSYELSASEDIRRVKIFAQDENGLNRFVCDYVCPLRSGRLIDSPSLASRFVSAIPIQSHSASSVMIGSPSSCNQDRWKSCLAFVVENRGNTENHALLLCSLLLGMGLNAFVATGTVRMNKNNQIIPHTWVITLQESEPNKAVFWESCTGRKYPFQSYPHKSPTTPNFQYSSIGCLFNHFQFFANNYKNCSIEMTLFQLTNPSRWKSMSESVIADLGIETRYFPRHADDLSKNGGGLTWSNKVPLTLGRLNSQLNSIETCTQMSNDLEHQLRSLIEVMRHHRIQQSSSWDDQLCYLLGQALFSYEQEQLTGITNLANDEFKQAVQRHVQPGYTFKAYPLHVLHMNAKLILDQAMKSPVFEEILNCRGTNAKFAVRVRVFSYAENVTPTWVIFGCTYSFN